ALDNAYRDGSRQMAEFEGLRGSGDGPPEGAGGLEGRRADRRLNSAVGLVHCKSVVGKMIGPSPCLDSTPNLFDALVRWRGAQCLLRQHLDEAHAARRVTAEVDAVRVGRVNVDTPWIGLRLRQREFDPFLRLRVEAGDLIDLMLADPDITVLLIHDH